MSDGRGMPLLSRPPPEYTANEPACRKCNKEFNILFTRSRRCNHCGYSYCHSCTDYQALMPRRGSGEGERDPGNTSGYDPMPVCAFCIEMLQITASGKGQLKQLPMAKLKKYAKAYNIDVAGVIEKDDFIDRLVAARGPDGCLPPEKESYYRKHSVPNRASNRPRGLFSRAMDAVTGERGSTSPTPPPRQQPQTPQPRQHPPRQRTTSGPSRYAPQGYPGAHYQQQQQRPAQYPPHPHYQPSYAPPPGYPPSYVHPHGYTPQYTQAPPRPHSNPNVPPQTGRRRAASASRASTPRATSPARPAVVVPSIDELLDMSDEQLAALSIGSLKEILFKNHVTARLVVEKSELVARVRTLIEEERAERERKAAEEAAERELEEEMRRARVESMAGSTGAAQGTGTEGGGDAGHGDAGRDGAPASSESVPVPQDQPSSEGAPNSSPQAASSPKQAASPAPASSLSPKAQQMASRLERTGLCVICQDEEANIAIVDCGHLAMCRACSDLIMNSTRECPLCRTRIVTESRLLRIFKT